ncbi:RNA polymerase sigma factor [Psychrobacillus lasiicapitis]|uniref:RNA polymerase sigma factor n=1 Tax=Psychrobacillus lasiicapitis TaxID=1636719 RepID=A0A544SV81_9BACI|nr:sigma-70 family RNA polymerase sigma factor [Psychrobacillus lasiicapitis]TQR09093.1 sigma-70 family RNA polymerase sigma factor [Psychrobacillus lasiicapitis]GGA47459.1 ECF RNA polymerase sigma factor SigM [Psychrobacillus lasiicapitis]
MEKSLIEKWFELYEQDITSFLIYYTGSMEIEDLVQETFLRAWSKINKYNESSHPKTWLISIARNMVIDRYRRNRVWSKIRHTLLQEQNFSNSTEQHIILNQENSHLYNAISQLPSKYKEVIILKGILEMSSKEVSHVMKSNENNINVIYHRSLKKIKTLLEKEGYEYGGL